MAELSLACANRRSRYQLQRGQKFSLKNGRALCYIYVRILQAALATPRSPSAFPFQHSAFSIQHSAFSVQPSAFNIQHSAFRVQHSPFHGPHAIPTRASPALPRAPATSRATLAMARRFTNGADNAQNSLPSAPQRRDHAPQSPSVPNGAQRRITTFCARETESAPYRAKLQTSHNSHPSLLTPRPSLLAAIPSSLNRSAPNLSEANHLLRAAVGRQHSCLVRAHRRSRPTAHRASTAPAAAPLLASSPCASSPAGWNASNSPKPNSGCCGRYQRLTHRPAADRRTEFDQARLAEALAVSPAQVSGVVERLALPRPRRAADARRRSPPPALAPHARGLHAGRRSRRCRRCTLHDHSHGRHAA